MIDELEEYRAYAVHLNAEHRRLEESLRRVEELWQHKVPRPPHFSARLAGGLSELRAALARHYEDEEEGGCLEEAVAHLPTLSREVTKLNREHSQVLSTMDQLIAQVRTLRPGNQEWAEIERDFQAIAERLRAHEAAESRILKASFGNDVP
jgi:hypothetical protein